MSENLYNILRYRFPKNRGAKFIETPNDRSIMYDDVDRLTAIFAAAMLNLGIDRGHRLLVSIDKSPEAILIYLAALRLEAIFVPLNPTYTDREFKYFLENSTPTVVILRNKKDKAKIATAKQMGAKVATINTSNEGSFIDLANVCKPFNLINATKKTQPAAILYTSGTTGKPKGVVLTHGNLSSNGKTLHHVWGFQPGDVLLHALPVFHVHGLFVAIHCAMLNASKIIYLEKFDIDLVIDQLQRATVMMGVPTFYTRLLKHPSLDASLCKNMRLFISGSAALLPQTWIDFKAKTKHEIIERYGMSEAGMITSNPLNGERLPGTVGFTLPDIEVRVTSEDGTKLSSGKIGVLEVKGPNVFSGYWRRPELTATEFRSDGFFISGDMATVSASGRIKIVGRNRDLIISGGLNVYPNEIEDSLNILPGIIESAVIGVIHPDLGESVVACIVTEASFQCDENEIIDALKNQLASYKVPRRIIRLESLPKNIMGKIQKNMLRQRYSVLP